VARPDQRRGPGTRTPTCGPAGARGEPADAAGIEEVDSLRERALAAMTEAAQLGGTVVVVTPRRHGKAGDGLDARLAAGRIESSHGSHELPLGGDPMAMPIAGLGAALVQRRRSYQDCWLDPTGPPRRRRTRRRRVVASIARSRPSRPAGTCLIEPLVGAGRLVERSGAALIARHGRPSDTCPAWPVSR